jgi:multidrug resistance protein, MATE family
VFMSGAAILFLALPTLLVGAFSADPAVIETGKRLFWVAAAFQLFDGLQAVATGVLRGLGDTRTPMAANLAGHWLLGLPLGYGLTFHFGLGVVGMWMGLSAGLILIGSFLLLTWARRARALPANSSNVLDQSVPLPAS